MGKRTLLTYLLILLSTFGFAQIQDLSNWRSTNTTFIKHAQQIDSLSIIPASLEIFDSITGISLAKKQYSLNNNILTLDTSIQLPKVLSLRYRVYPYDLNIAIQHLDSTQIQVADDGTYIGFDYSPYESAENIFDSPGLVYDGNFSRGISFGNAQNLVLNSEFNLRMTGTIGDDVEILAAISDQNIPLQPEGNTQQLQEFDKIFIQLKKDSNKLIAGDYELKRPDSYFMNYFKKLQGATFSNYTDVGKKGGLNSQISAAIARGQFARNIITPQEGNQGPYNLRGNEGERFIIVLAGTEKVYIDGELLQRGLEKDYTIDYNSGYLTFTEKRLITKDIRIIVEFEYSNQNYLRSMVAVNTEFKTDKLRAYFNVFSEQDGKNSTGIQDLSLLQRQRLRAIGDDVQNAFASGIDTIGEFNEFRVSYKLIDSIYNFCGNVVQDSVLVYSTNPDSSLYEGSFLEVGFGNGDYILDETNPANGRVFQWLAPDPVTCLRRGNFDVIVKLIAPNRQQMVTLGAEYQTGKNSSLLAEVAISNNDLNLLSDVDDADDLGAAIHAKYLLQKKIKAKWQLNTELKYEFVQERFDALKPYRNAEFTRDWNVRTQSNRANSGQIVQEKTNEHLGGAKFILKHQKNGQLEYEFSGFIREGIYDGTRHKGRFLYNKNGFKADLIGNELITNGQVENTHFSRPKFTISKQFKKLNDWEIGVWGEREKNSRIAVLTDTLNATSFWFDRYQVYLKSPVKKGFSWESSFTQRWDYAPVNTEFEQSTFANDVNLTGKWSQGKASRLKWTLSYRQLDIVDSLLTDEKPLETFLGRIDHSLKLWKGTVYSNTNYELGSGQEPKITYRYLQVQPGEGVYFWDADENDYNGDGVPQVDEIRQEFYSGEGNVIRIILFTDEFIRTNKVSLNQTLRITPRRIWANKKKGFKKWLSKFSTQSTMQINRRTREDEQVQSYNPFQININDTSLVAINSNIQNILFFKPDPTVFILQVGATQVRNRTVLTTGFQSRPSNEEFIRANWNLNKTFTFNMDLTRGHRESDYEFFQNQDYDIEFFKLAPKLTFRHKRSFRLSLTYSYENGKNVLIPNGETSLKNDLTAELSYNKATKTFIDASFSFAQVNFTGEKNSPIEIAMLQGLRNGENFLWRFSFNRTIAQNITLGLLYNGRKTGVSNVVHIGSVQIGAKF